MKQYEHCALSQKSPAHVPLHPWEWPSHPWARLHVDYAGPFMGKMFLVLVDANSKWMDVHTLPSVFLRQNGIRHITSAPYHLATNGLAERAIQILKNSLKKSRPGDTVKQLARLLFHYRTTLHVTTGISPAELLMGRPLHTHLDLLRPNIAIRVHMSQDSQKLNYDRKSRSRSFSAEDTVFARQSNNDSPWIPGLWLRSLEN